jgi:hypothetical protein
MPSLIHRASCPIQNKLEQRRTRFPEEKSRQLRSAQSAALQELAALVEHGYLIT